MNGIEDTEGPIRVCNWCERMVTVYFGAAKPGRRRCELLDRNLEKKPGRYELGILILTPKDCPFEVIYDHNRASPPND